VNEEVTGEVSRNVTGEADGMNHGVDSRGRGCSSSFKIAPFNTVSYSPNIAQF